MKNSLMFLACSSLLGLAACTTSQPVAQNDVQPTEQRYPSSDNMADRLYEGGPSVNLDKCGGHDGVAQLKRDNGSLYLYVANMECASWATSKDGYQVHRLESEGGMQHGGRILIDESVTGERQLILGSANFISKYAVDPNGTGATKGDLVKFYVKPQRVLLDLRFDTDGKTTGQLTQCGGTVEAQVNKDRSLSVIFRKVTSCSNFAIMNANGQPLTKIYDLQEQGFSNGGSFTISTKDIQWGNNEISLAVYTPHGREDKLVLKVYGSPF